MAFVLPDRVKETCTSPGTGNVSTLGAVSGFQTFASVGVGNTTYYAIEDQSGGAGRWETGIGTYSATNTLQRTSVISSSNSNSLVNFNSGTQNVFVTFPANRTLAAYSMFGFFPGTTTSQTGTLRKYASSAYVITLISAWATGNVPSNTTLTIKKNGTSIGTAVISSGASTGNSGAVSLSVAVGDYITIDLTSTGAVDVGVRIDYQ